MIYGNLRNNLSINNKRKYRNFENLCKKLIKNKWSVVFNTTCLNTLIGIHCKKITMQKLNDFYWQQESNSRIRFCCCHHHPGSLQDNSLQKKSKTVFITWLFIGKFVKLCTNAQWARIDYNWTKLFSLTIWYFFLLLLVSLFELIVN